MNYKIIFEEFCKLYEIHDKHTKIEAWAAYFCIALPFSMLLIVWDVKLWYSVRELGIKIEIPVISEYLEWMQENELIISCCCGEMLLLGVALIYIIVMIEDDQNADAILSDSLNCYSKNGEELKKLYEGGTGKGYYTALFMYDIMSKNGKNFSLPVVKIKLKELSEYLRTFNGDDSLSELQEQVNPIIKKIVNVGLQTLASLFTTVIITKGLDEKTIQQTLSAILTMNVLCTVVVIIFIVRMFAYAPKMNDFTKRRAARCLLKEFREIQDFIDEKG